MKKIVIKEIDRLASGLHKDRVISEYLIYLILIEYGDPLVPLEAYCELGDESKNARVNELILTHFMNDESNKEINKNEIIQEVSFEEYIKQLNTKCKKPTR